MTTILSTADQRLVKRALAVLDSALRQPGALLTSPAAVRDFLALRLRGREREEFHVLYLDSQNRLIEARTESTGTLTQTSVYPREIAKTALALNCAALIVAHNHPSGVAEPSAADRVLTNTLTNTLAKLDVAVLDHIIVGSDRCYSFAEAGLMI